ncbi:MAG TPA: PAS domain-containing sensor histidine kinase [Candidatus Limnocylindrales bacterium]|nr:PAS domain-containing sensor histidine kinase [Candidatus Limnocylindrales bacterium]
MKHDNNQSLAGELLEVQRTLGWMDLVIGSIGDAVYVTGKDSRLVFANQCFSDLVGTPRIFLLGQGLQEIFVTKPVAKIPIEFKDEATATASHGLNTGIYEWRNREGIKHVFRISSQVLKTTDQTVYLAQNITREYELSRMKSNFIDLASHQLRTPMTAVMTYTHMLHDGFGGELTPSQQKLSSTIIEASERMVKLVNDLLTITRAQNNTATIAKTDVLIESVFQEISTEVGPALDAQELQLNVSVDPASLSIASNRHMLHEVFSNLVVNAIQYTPAGGSISLKARLVSDQLCVDVSDTGIGIPEEYLPKLFTQFSRAENATIAYPEGTGLGLYMIKLLLEKLGGTIACSSKLHKGTTFTVTLPYELIEE